MTYPESELDTKCPGSFLQGNYLFVKCPYDTASLEEIERLSGQEWEVIGFCNQLSYRWVTQFHPRIADTMLRLSHIRAMKVGRVYVKYYYCLMKRRIT